MLARNLGLMMRPLYVEAVMAEGKETRQPDLAPQMVAGGCFGLMSTTMPRQIRWLSFCRPHVLPRRQGKKKKKMGRRDPETLTPSRW